MKNFALLVLLLIVSCSRTEVARPMLEPAVIVTKVEKRSLLAKNRFVARVIADEIVHIRPRVEGVLVEQNFIEGRRVEAGDQLFQIEKDVYEADVKQAIGDRDNAIAALKLAISKHERVETLYKQKAIAKLEYDQSLADKEQARAAFSKSEGQLAKAELALKWTRITTPVAGRTGVVSINKGNLVSVGTDPLVTVTKDDQMKVEFTINEKQLIRSLLKEESRNAEKGDELKFVKVQLFLPEGTAYKHLGRIAFWDNRINPSTGSLKVRALFPNEEGILSDGMYVQILTYSDKKDEVLLIPQASVLEDQVGKYVFCVNDKSIVEKRKIVVSKQVGAEIGITSGLVEGEKVILQGLQKVVPGRKVKATLAIEGQ